MADFEPCFNLLMELEGGYKLVDDPTDKGGLTYAGISMKAFPEWEGWEYVVGPGDNTLANDHVKALYRTEFWNRIKGDDINYQDLASLLFTSVVNMGVSWPVKSLQKEIGVKVDGSIGPKSIEAINALETNEACDLYYYFAFALIKRYNTLCMKDSRARLDKLYSNRRFLSGWIMRFLSGGKNF